MASSENADLPVVVIEPTRGWVALRLSELFTYRELLGFLAWRDVTVRYRQTLLGRRLGSPSAAGHHDRVQRGLWSASWDPQ